MICNVKAIDEGIDLPVGFVSRIASTAKNIITVIHESWRSEILHKHFF